MSDRRLSKALMTGATSGIGRAVASKLAADGVEVIVHGRDTEREAQTVKEIERSGAGHSGWGPTADLDVATFDGMFAANVRAPFDLVAAFAPGMAARGEGSTINVSRMAGRLGLLNGAAYGATKAALVSLTQAVRQAGRHHATQPRGRARGDCG